MYNDISSCVMNGGHSTGYFYIKGGLGKGIHSRHIYLYWP